MGYIGESVRLFASPDTDADGQQVSNTWLIDGKPIDSALFTPTEARKHRVTLLQNDGQNAPNSIDSAVVEITPRDIPVIYPDYPKAIITGRSLSIDDIGISSDWKFQIGDRYDSRWTAGDVGEQELRLYWFNENEPVYFRSYPIQVKSPLTFDSTRTTLKINFTPANPEVIVNAPDLNRSSNEVRFTWYAEDGQIMGYGPQIELTLSEGENLFTVVAKDIDTKGSEAVETDLLIITE